MWHTAELKILKAQLVEKATKILVLETMIQAKSCLSSAHLDIRDVDIDGARAHIEVQRGVLDIATSLHTHLVQLQAEAGTSEEAHVIIAGAATIAQAVAAVTAEAATSVV